MSRKTDSTGSGKLWGGRFTGATDPTVERFSASIHFDKALARYDIRGSIAHARMLGESGIIPADDADTLVHGLEAIAAEIEAGDFPFDPALEDIHMNIESRLSDAVGPVAGRLHTGRSRNDQVATDLALYLRDACEAAQRSILDLRAILLERATEHIDTVLPGYTHLQRAQPVRLAHHWLAFFELLGRDAQRFRDAGQRLKECPLGAGAIAGSTLPLQREHTARALGFDAPTRNSMDSVSARDGALEFMAAAAICMVGLSRLAEELVIWSSSEFGFVELADAYSTGSSLMPQKKNPDVPEIVRGKTGRVVGNLVSLLTTLKGLPLTYNRDMQEDKEPLFDSAATLRDCLEVMAGTIATLEVNVERMATAAQDPMLLATDLAEALVREGVPFREAHETVGRIVAHCVGGGHNLGALSRETLQDFHADFSAGSAELLNIERSFAQRDLVGGTARTRVEAALTSARSEIAGVAADLGDGIET
ncbi:MAG: argininosuccinate lyase [Myxococcota bacterium]|jgi:argininosuccinate lyase|nr:argininosuccinate lyase [Myxococcota bacterium]